MSTSTMAPGRAFDQQKALDEIKNELEYGFRMLGGVGLGLRKILDTQRPAPDEDFLLEVLVDRLGDEVRTLRADGPPDHGA